MDKKNIEGEIDEAKGRVKSAAGELTGNEDLKGELARPWLMRSFAFRGELTGNEDLKGEGAIDKAKGKLKDAFGTARDKIKKGLDKLDE